MQSDYVDAMNREPNVVTKGLGERVVKPATEILWAGFFWCRSNRKGEHELIEKIVSKRKRPKLNRVHIGAPSGSPGILDRRSGHTSRPEFSSSLGEGSRLRYLTFFLHGLSGES